MGIYFVKEFEIEPDKLLAMTFEPKLEQTLIGRVKRSQFDVGLMMDPGLTEGLISEIEPRIKEMTDQGHTPLIVTTSELRLAFGDLWNHLSLNWLFCLIKSCLRKRESNHLQLLHWLINHFLRVLQAMENPEVNQGNQPEGVAVAA